MKFASLTIITFALTYQAIAESTNGCLQTYNITDNDSCLTVAAQFKITEADLYAMNPSIHHTSQQDCDNLNVGEIYCVCTTAPCPVTYSKILSSSTFSSSSVSSQYVTSSTATPSSNTSPISSDVSSAFASNSISSAPTSSVTRPILTTASLNSSKSFTRTPLITPSLIASTTPSIPNTSGAPLNTSGFINIGIALMVIRAFI